MGLPYSIPLRWRKSDEQKSPSRFYRACRDGDLALVQELLPTMTVKNIDRVENGSTALHSACYYGHAAVVDLLLKAGASRYPKNIRYKLTPLDEARNDEIRRLFSQVSSASSNRFVGTSFPIEWSLNTSEAVQWKSRLSKLLQPNRSFQETIQYLMDNYLRDQVLLPSAQLKPILAFFQSALEENDATHLVRAYTSNSAFSGIVNHHLAERLFQSFRREPMSGPLEQSVACLASIFLHRPELQTFSFTGEVYRGLLLSQADFDQYHIDQRLLNKSFLSTSKDPLVATIYAGLSVRNRARRSRDGDLLQFPVIFTYQIRNQGTALDISHLSNILSEQEVLIKPLRAFQVRAIRFNHDADIDVEIDLEECDDDESEMNV